jgi:hypothetical protein
MSHYYTYMGLLGGGKQCKYMTVTWNNRVVRNMRYNKNIGRIWDDSTCHDAQGVKYETLTDIPWNIGWAAITDTIKYRANMRW